MYYKNNQEACFDHLLNTTLSKNAVHSAKKYSFRESQSSIPVAPGSPGGAPCANEYPCRKFISPENSRFISGKFDEENKI